MHPDYHASAYLQFRLRLLRYTALYANRFAPSRAAPTASALQAMQKKHHVRAMASPYHSRLPRDLEDVNLVVSEQEALTLVDSKHSYLPSPSLLDTLPEFIALSAAKGMLEGSNITDFWMKLAVGYMTHAVVEQILVFGNPGIGPLRDAFAWGFDENSTVEDGSEELQINAMFMGENGTVDGWDDLREVHIRAVSI